MYDARKRKSLVNKMGTSLLFAGLFTVQLSVTALADPPPPSATIHVRNCLGESETSLQSYWFYSFNSHDTSSLLLDWEHKNIEGGETADLHCGTDKCKIALYKPDEKKFFVALMHDNAYAIATSTAGIQAMRWLLVDAEMFSRGC